MAHLNKLLALWVALVIGFAGPAWPGQESTTHRVGDPVGFQVGCHDAESMIRIAEHGGAAEILAAMVERDECFIYRGMVRAVLTEWVAGPHLVQGTDVSASIWEVRVSGGIAVYSWIVDHGGRHSAGESAALELSQSVVYANA
jgi:hypothetical protein